MISNFIKRAITGILFVAILVGCILYNSFSFGILFMAISALTIYEFGQLVNSRAEGANVNKTIIMLGGAYLFLAVMDSALTQPTLRFSFLICCCCSI